ncbi:phospholipase A1-IIdelta isoform X2 [Actinidia eriantha]|uniref:phospholipase A1-IIdelta isoform X2 n=1 Tax=Actinidia eriantha TaxID=165200 RepID=UPI002590D161|nr:phospholipase A1-IIdelta isoform X2 [Actinidia eriantha]
MNNTSIITPKALSSREPSKQNPFPDPYNKMDTDPNQHQPTWSELLGSNNWDGLLHPLDLSLRRLILLSGDLCQATYDAFNNDSNSPFCGSSRYGKPSFFNKVMFDSAAAAAVGGGGGGDLKIAAFLYATARVGVQEAFLLHSLSRESWDRESNWIGYVAVGESVGGRREIYVAWRGTTRTYEWIDVLGAKPDSAAPLLRPKAIKKYELSGRKDDTPSDTSSSSDEEDEKVPKVMKGWLTIYTSDDPNSPFTKLSARTQFQNKIKELVNQYKDDELSIILTGHSLGASLSVLSGFDLVENGITDIPIAAFVFGCPQVGNKAFNERIKQFPNFKILHIKNKIDLIPLYPSGLLGYVNSGIDLEIDTRKSPFLKDSKNPSDWHNLQAILHVVAGWNGEEREFELKVKRSLALVNKSCDYLKDECLVPATWWVEKNRGMVIRKDGDWALAPPDEEDLPVPELF